MADFTIPDILKMVKDGHITQADAQLLIKQEDQKAAQQDSVDRMNMLVGRTQKEMSVPRYGTKNALSGLAGAAGGGLTGGLVGSAGGPVGAGIGALLGGLGGAFSKTPGEAVVNTALAGIPIAPAASVVGGIAKNALIHGGANLAGQVAKTGIDERRLIKPEEIDKNSLGLSTAIGGGLGGLKITPMSSIRKKIQAWQEQYFDKYIPKLKEGDVLVGKLRESKIAEELAGVDAEQGTKAAKAALEATNRRISEAAATRKDLTEKARLRLAEATQEAKVRNKFLGKTAVDANTAQNHVLFEAGLEHEAALDNLAEAQAASTKFSTDAAAAQKLAAETRNMEGGNEVLLARHGFVEPGAGKVIPGPPSTGQQRNLATVEARLAQRRGADASKNIPGEEDLATEVNLLAAQARAKGTAERLSLAQQGSISTKGAVSSAAHNPLVDPNDFTNIYANLSKAGDAHRQALSLLPADINAMEAAAKFAASAPGNATRARLGVEQLIEDNIKAAEKLNPGKAPPAPKSLGKKLVDVASEFGPSIAAGAIADGASGSHWAGAGAGAGVRIVQKLLNKSKPILSTAANTPRILPTVPPGPIRAALGRVAGSKAVPPGLSALRVLLSKLGDSDQQDPTASPDEAAPPEQLPEDIVQE